MAMDSTARRRLSVLGILLSGAVLSGCATDIKARGAEVYDRVLEENEYIMCEAGSVRSVREKYWQSIELARAWSTICLGDPRAVEKLFGIKREPEGEG